MFSRLWIIFFHGRLNIACIIALAALLGCWVGWVAGQLDLQGGPVALLLAGCAGRFPHLTPALRVAFAPAKSGGTVPRGSERSDLPLGAGCCIVGAPESGGVAAGFSCSELS